MTVLRVHRDCEFEFAWPVFQPDGVTPMDLTGWTASGWVRSVYRDEVLVADVAPWFGLAAGIATLTIPGPTSTAWVWARGLFSFYLTDTDARTSPLDSGLLLVTDF